MKLHTVLIASLFASSCATGVGAELREHTYPRELRYIARGEIQSAMLTLARGVADLDHLLSQGELAEPELSGAVVERLTAMRSAAQALDPGAARTSHPVLERYMGAFLAELERATEDARALPPRYFRAGTVVGACTSCHVAAR